MVQLWYKKIEYKEINILTNFFWWLETLAPKNNPIYTIPDLVGLALIMVTVNIGLKMGKNYIYKY